MSQPHVLIVGGGIIGLVLAHALKKSSIPFTVFERDPTLEFQGAGWGMSIHYAVEAFLSYLPQEVLDELDFASVDPESERLGIQSKFPLFNLQTGVAYGGVNTPKASKKLRVARQRLRMVLRKGLDIKWDKALVSISTDTPGSVTATFTDGTSYTGTHLAGCDGVRSKVRQVLCPDHSKPNRLPIGLLGFNRLFTPEQLKPIRDVEPYFFAASDVSQDVNYFYGLMDIPSSNTRTGPDHDLFDVQLVLSWPLREGLFGESGVLNTPDDNKDRIALLRRLSANWTEPFRSLIYDVPDDTIIRTIHLEDWDPSETSWDNRDGRVTLLGDAAHPMTMYRGEGVNQGIADIKSYLQMFLSLYERKDANNEEYKKACDVYEKNMIKRGGLAVRLAHQAAFDAHDRTNMKLDSPLIQRPAIDMSKLIEVE